MGSFRVPLERSTSLKPLVMLTTKPKGNDGRDTVLNRTFIPSFRECSHNANPNVRL